MSRHTTNPCPHTHKRIHTGWLSLWIIGAIGIAIGLVLPARGERCADPAPPQVHEIGDEDPPSPRPHLPVTFHQPPRPLAPGAMTHDWPTFLGPQRNGTSPETSLLKDWGDDGPRVLWEMKKGESYSAPSVSGHRLIFFHRVNDKEVVECLHPESGQLYWTFRYGTNYKDRYGFNNGPRATPVIDQDRVYTVGAQAKLHCLDLRSGKLIWARDLASEFRLPQGFFGFTPTPLVHGNLLIINIGAPGGPCVVAFDKTTGQLLWCAGDQWGSSYASAIVGAVHGQPKVLVFAGGDARPPVGGLLVIAPATGEISVRVPWRSEAYESVNAATPVLIENQVFITASYRTGGTLIELLPDGGSKTKWTTQALSCHWNTPILLQGHLYGFDGRNSRGATLVCLEVAGGEAMWREEITWEDSIMDPSGRQRTLPMSPARGCLLYLDGHFLCLGEFGHLLWLELSPKGYRVLARKWLFSAPESWVPPVISRGLLYVLQNRPDTIHNTSPRLLCYDLRAAN